MSLLSKLRKKLGMSELRTSDLFSNPTPSAMCEFVSQSLKSGASSEFHAWSPLGMSEGPASNAQQRLFLDEQVRFSKESSAMYHVPLAMRVGPGSPELDLEKLHKVSRVVVVVVGRACVVCELREEELRRKDR
jgi:hypothetical protein